MVVGLWLLAVHRVTAQDTSLLWRMWNYPDSVLCTGGVDGSAVLPTDTFETNLYEQYWIRVERRNVTMLTVPNMYDIAHGKQREFAAETYSTLRSTIKKDVGRFRHLNISNVRRRRSVLDNVRGFLSIRPYETTLVGGHLLSPFHGSNRHFYKYETKDVGGLAIVHFSPRLYNTQLVKGLATVDGKTGRVIGARMEGEYDMARFVVRVTMGSQGIASLLPERCESDVLLRFVGNKISSHFLAVNNLPVSLPMSISNADSLELMDSLRPEGVAPPTVMIAKLRNTEIVVDETDSVAEASADSISHGPRLVHKVGDAVWDVIQDNMLNPIRTDFGTSDRHSLRIGPIFNPLYLDYSKSRGVTYRLRMDFEYQLGDNSSLDWELRGGYSFKQRQVYFNTPLTWNFNERRNGYLRVELANGNRISTSDVLSYVKSVHRGDTINFDNLNLSYFKDTWLQTTFNYALSSHVSGQLGFIYHRRSSVSAADFQRINLQRVYYSFAPLLSISWTPLSTPNSPVLTANYEHGLRDVFKSNMGYSRWEFDGQYILPLRCTRSLSLRAGVGFYLSKNGQRYFLDYTNFRKNNLPGGWNDDYSGEFELLHSDWYNASDYYVRMNATYESPLLLFSRLPLVGRLVERERIYLSTLAVRSYFPYVECGYGVTNRLCSVSSFFAFSRKGYEGFGLRFGFELFSNW